MSHGYEDLPESCSYKLGVNAEESMRNLNGTHIDVWTMKHDKEVREKVLDELVSMIQSKQPLPEPYDDWNKGVLDGCEIAINTIDEMRTLQNKQDGE